MSLAPSPACSFGPRQSSTITEGIPAPHWSSRANMGEDSFPGQRGGRQASPSLEQILAKVSPVWDGMWLHPEAVPLSSGSQSLTRPNATSSHGLGPGALSKGRHPGMRRDAPRPREAGRGRWLAQTCPVCWMVVRKCTHARHNAFPTAHCQMDHNHATCPLQLQETAQKQPQLQRGSLPSGVWYTAKKNT